MASVPCFKKHPKCFFIHLYDNRLTTRNKDNQNIYQNKTNSVSYENIIELKSRFLRNKNDKDLL